MEKGIALHRNVVFTTRDFMAESQANDGTMFQVTLRRRADDRVREWWEKSRFDNNRHVFAPADRDEDGYLECVDEVECLALITSMQERVNSEVVQ